MKYQRKEQKHIPEVQAGSKREKLASSLWQKSTVFPNVPDSSASVRLPLPPRLPFLSCESAHIADRHWSQALAQRKCESYLGSLICCFQVLSLTISACHSRGTSELPPLYTPKGTWKGVSRTIIMQSLTLAEAGPPEQWDD